eukprot:2348862-Prymnesium_polylepis.1
MAHTAGTLRRCCWRRVAAEAPRCFRAATATTALSLVPPHSPSRVVRRCRRLRRRRRRPRRRRRRPRRRWSSRIESGGRGARWPKRRPREGWHGARRNAAAGGLGAWAVPCGVEPLERATWSRQQTMWRSVEACLTRRSLGGRARRCEHQTWLGERVTSRRSCALGAR